MPLLEPSTALPTDRLLAIRTEALADLAEYAELLADVPGTSLARSARGLTARTLVADTAAWAARGPAPTSREALVAEINLLYDVSLVAAEYYKLFVREPTPERGAGRI